MPLKTKKSGKELLFHVAGVSLVKLKLGLISWTSDLHKASKFFKWLLTWCQQNLCVQLVAVQKPVSACEAYKIYLQNWLLCLRSHLHILTILYMKIPIYLCMYSRETSSFKYYPGIVEVSCSSTYRSTPICPLS